MNIISLNTWGGRVAEQSQSFIESHKDIDIFCLQEVYHHAQGKDTIWQEANFNLFSNVSRMLPDHTGLYHPHLGDWWGARAFY